MFRFPRLKGHNANRLKVTGKIYPARMSKPY